VTDNRVGWDDFETNHRLAHDSLMTGAVKSLGLTPNEYHIITKWEMIITANGTSGDLRPVNANKQ